MLFVGIVGVLLGAFGADSAAAIPQIAWVDLNGDGLQDMIRLQPGSAPSFFLNDGAGGFEPYSIDSPILTAPLTRLQVVQDAPAGRVILLATNHEATYALDLTDGSVQVRAQMPPAQSVDVRDFDGDQRVDVIVDGRIYRQRAGGTFTEVELPGIGRNENRAEALAPKTVKATGGDLVVAGSIQQLGNDANSFAGDVEIAQRLEVQGSASAQTYYGDGSHLTGVVTDPIWNSSRFGIYYSDNNVGIGVMPGGDSRLEVRQEGSAGIGIKSYSQSEAGVQGESTYATGVSGTGSTGVVGAGEVYGVQALIGNPTGLSEAALMADAGSSGALALHVTTAGFQSAAFVENSNILNPAPALYCKTSGTGSAAYFQIPGIGNSQPAVEIVHNGSGTPLRVTSNGSGTGIFVLQNDLASTADGVRVESYSSGAAVHAINWNGGPALVTFGPSTLNGDTELTGDAVLHGDLDVSGTARAQVLEITGGADLAERFEVSGPVAPGMVVSIDPDHPGKLRVSSEARDRRVVGVISGGNNLAAGVVLGAGTAQVGEQPIAMSGRAWVACDVRERPVHVGDFLTTSARVGHAMAVADPAAARGAIIGKAMTELPRGDAGWVLLFVNPS